MEVSGVCRSLLGEFIKGCGKLQEQLSEPQAARRDGAVRFIILNPPGAEGEDLKTHAHTQCGWGKGKLFKKEIIKIQRHQMPPASPARGMLKRELSFLELEKTEISIFTLHRKIRNTYFLIEEALYESICTRDWKLYSLFSVLQFRSSKISISSMCSVIFFL